MAIPITDKLVAPDKELPKPGYMKYPDWLKIDDASFQILYLDIVALREYYSIFFHLENPVAQISIGESLMQRLSHAETCIYNKYDTSIEAQGYAKSQINYLNQKWLEMLGSIVAVPTLGVFGIEAEIDLDHGIQLHGDQDLRLLTEGKSETDFLSKHPNTKKAFMSFSLNAWMNRNNKTTEE